MFAVPALCNYLPGCFASIGNEQDLNRLKTEELRGRRKKRYLEDTSSNETRMGKGRYNKADIKAFVILNPRD